MSKKKPKRTMPEILYVTGPQEDNEQPLIDRHDGCRFFKELIDRHDGWMSTAVQYDGRQVYVWITQPWISLWFVHGPDRFNIFTFAFESREP